MWIVSWDPFLMKKLLKSEICGSVNSTRCAVIGQKNWKVKVCGYCLLNSAWTVATTSKTLQNAWKKKKKADKTQTQFFSAESKRSHNLRLCQWNWNTHLDWKKWDGYTEVHKNHVIGERIVKITVWRFQKVLEHN